MKGATPFRIFLSAIKIPYLLILLFAVCFNLGLCAGGPTSWRLVCNSSTSTSWHLCDLKFLADRDCTTVVQTAIQGRVSSQTQVKRYGIPLDAVFLEWASSCTACAVGEAFLGAQFAAPVVVQCVRFAGCTSAGAASQSLSGTSCNNIVLERINNQVVWEAVAGWKSPLPKQLSLRSASFRPYQSPPMAVSWSPGPMSCSSCGANGVPASQQIRLTFSEQIFFGDGNIQIQRGGGELSTLQVPISNSAWFTVANNQLLITPQEPLGTSSSCCRISISQQAIFDADGEFYTPASPYTVCLADILSPVLLFSDPVNQTPSVELRPRIQLSFNEMVVIAQNAPLVHLIPAVARSASGVAAVDIDLRGPNVWIHTWQQEQRAAAVTINLVNNLAPRTTYELYIPSSAILDSSDNPFSGVTLSFTTRASGTPATPAPSAQNQQNSENNSNTGSPIATAMLVLSILAVLVAIPAYCLWKCYVRRANSSEHLPLRRQVYHSKVAPALHVGSAHSAYSGATAKAPSVVTASCPTGGPRSQNWAQAAQDTGTPATKDKYEDFRRRRGPFGRSMEAEDVNFQPQRKANPAQSHTFTDEYAELGGWVRSVDQATGRTCWVHHKTLETRWDLPRTAAAAGPASPPPKSKTRNSGSPSSFNSGPPPRASWEQPREKARPPAHPKTEVAENITENSKVARVKADVMAQLKNTNKESLASRKKTFKFLCLQWHPDKNPEDKELATEIFQFLQQERDTYLKE